MPGSERHAGTNFNYQWDTSLLEWIKEAPASGGGLGGLTDAQLRASPVPVSGPLTDIQLRALAVPVSISGTIPVSGALTDTELRATPVPVSGPLTDTQLRATAVPVSGPVTDAQIRATALPVSGTFFQATQPVSIAGTVAVSSIGGGSAPLRESIFTGRWDAVLTLGTGYVKVAIQGNPIVIPTINGTAYSSGAGVVDVGTQRVVLATDQSSIPVTGTFFQATQPVSIAGSVTAPTIADVFDPDGTAGYSVTQTGKKLTQTYDGRLRTLVAGYVGTEFNDATPRSPHKAMPLTADGRAQNVRDEALLSMMATLIEETRLIKLTLSLAHGITF